MSSVCVCVFFKFIFVSKWYRSIPPPPVRIKIKKFCYEKLYFLSCCNFIFRSELNLNVWVSIKSTLEIRTQLTKQDYFRVKKKSWGRNHFHLWILLAMNNFQWLMFGCVTHPYTGAYLLGLMFNIRKIIRITQYLAKIEA